MHISYRAYLRKKYSYSKSGTLYIRIVVESQYVYQNTQIELETKYWNAAKRQVKKTHPNAGHINDLLLAECYKAQRAIFEHRLKGNEVNFASIKQLFDVTLACTDLTALFGQYVQETGVSGNRRYQMASCAKICLQHGLPNSVEKIREIHLLKFRTSLSKVYKKNTIIGIFTRLFAVLNFAVRMQIIPANPGKEMKVGSYRSKPNFLTQKEVYLIFEKMPQFDFHLQTIARMFLFACHTGLRFSDLTALKKTNLVETSNGKALLLITKKTDQQQLIPLLPEAEQLWPHVVGKKFTNEHYNRQLKVIGKICGITQPLTSHLARHSFATLGLSKGIRIEFMQSFLGHSNIKTTQGYAKLMDKTKFDELNKWST